MITRLFIIRHGQTDWNVQHRLQGSTDIPLNEYGISQAERLAQRLKEEQFAAVYSSPLSRAYETAKIATKHHQNIPITKVSHLAEFNLGRFEGKTYQETESELDWDKFFKDDEYRVQLGIEAKHETKNWVETEMQSIVQKHKNQSILFSTHGAKKRYLLKLLFSHHPESVSLIENTPLGNCAISIVDWHMEDGPTLFEYNNCAHLDL